MAGGFKREGERGRYEQGGTNPIVAGPKFHRASTGNGVERAFGSSVSSGRCISFLPPQRATLQFPYPLSHSNPPLPHRSDRQPYRRPDVYTSVFSIVYKTGVVVTVIHTAARGSRPPRAQRLPLRPTELSLSQAQPHPYSLRSVFRLATS